MALSTINSLIGEALDGAGAESKQVKNIVIAGNTTMAHLLRRSTPAISGGNRISRRFPNFRS